MNMHMRMYQCVYAYVASLSLCANGDFCFYHYTGDAGNTRDARGGVPPWQLERLLELLIHCQITRDDSTLLRI